MGNVVGEGWHSRCSVRETASSPPRIPRCYDSVMIRHCERAASSVRSSSVALFLAVVIPSASVAASDPVWPGFRGPGGLPVSDNDRLPLTWSTTENVEWKVTVPGMGWSSPIVAGDRVFLTTATSTTAMKTTADRYRVQQRVHRRAAGPGSARRPGAGASQCARHGVSRRADAAVLAARLRSRLRHRAVAPQPAFGAAAWRAPSQELLHLGDAGYRRRIGLRLHRQPRSVGLHDRR